MSATRSTVILSLAALLLGACSSSSGRGGTTPRARDDGAGAAGPRHRWRALSDMDPVLSMASTEEHLWVGTPGGLLRYPLQGGTPLRITGSAGPGDGQIIGIQADEGGLWAMSEGDIGRYERGAWSRTISAAPDVGEVSDMLAVGGTLWVGGTKGLVAHRNGAWKRWSPDAAVTRLEPDGGSGLWMGTVSGALWHIEADGVVSKHGVDRGVPCRGEVRALLPLEGDRVWALCGLDQGTILAEYDGQSWQGFSVDLDQRPMDLARCRNRAVLLTDDGLFRLMDHDPEEDELQPGDLALRPVTAVIKARPERVRITPTEPPEPPEERHARPRGRATPFKAPPQLAEDPWERPPVTRILRPVEVPVYHGATNAMCDERGLWVGTEGLGVTRIARGGQTTVYRTMELVVTERPFTVAADGQGRAWLLSRDLRAAVLGEEEGSYFQPSAIEPDATAGVQILSFGSRGMGAYALGRVRGTNVIRIYQHAGTEWALLIERELDFTNLDPPETEEEPEDEEAPAERALADFSFFEVDPLGKFWIGLLLPPAPGRDPVPAGVLVVDLEQELVLLHGTHPQGPGSTEIPDDIAVVDFTRNGDAWLGGIHGIIVLHVDGSIDRYSEANGLLGGVVNDIAIDTNDVPWVATAEGLGRWQNNTWRFFIDDMPENLHVQTVAVDSRGELWIGGNRGAAHYDGERWSVFTTRNGLLSNHVRSIHVDGRDRVWFVTDAGISMLERE